MLRTSATLSLVVGVGGLQRGVKVTKSVER